MRDICERAVRRGKLSLFPVPTPHKWDKEYVAQFNRRQLIQVYVASTYGSDKNYGKFW